MTSIIILWPKNFVSNTTCFSYFYVDKRRIPVCSQVFFFEYVYYISRYNKLYLKEFVYFLLRHISFILLLVSRIDINIRVYNKHYKSSAGHFESY